MSLAVSRDKFGCHDLRYAERAITGIWEVEARDAAKHPTRHRTIKNYPGPNINGVIDKFC